MHRPHEVGRERFFDTDYKAINVVYFIPQLQMTSHLIQILWGVALRRVRRIDILHLYLLDIACNSLLRRKLSKAIAKRKAIE